MALAEIMLFGDDFELLARAARLYARNVETAAEYATEPEVAEGRVKAAARARRLADLFDTAAACTIVRNEDT
jgi:hypothetical protein